MGDSFPGSGTIIRQAFIARGATDKAAFVMLPASISGGLQKQLYKNISAILQASFREYEFL